MKIKLHLSGKEKNINGEDISCLFVKMPDETVNRFMVPEDGPKVIGAKNRVEFFPGDAKKIKVLTPEYVEQPYLMFLEDKILLFPEGWPPVLSGSKLERCLSIPYENLAGDKWFMIDTEEKVSN